VKIGTTFDLIVHEKHLDTGGHEYMVWYVAACAVIPEVPSPMVGIHMACGVPDFAKPPHHNGSSQSMLDCAVENIENGVARSLLDCRHGLHVKIVEFALHPADSRPPLFMLRT